MIVEAGPFDYQTGKQLRNVVSLDLVGQRANTLYTEYDLQSGVISPDGTKLLIHQYKIGDKSIRPTGSRVCVLILATRTCQTIDLDGISNHFSWLDETNFNVPMNGLLYICSVEKLSCAIQPTPQGIYIERAIPTHTPNQVLIVALIQQSDGTAHFYYFDTITHTLTEIEQLRKEPIYNSDGIPVIQDYIQYISLTTDDGYLILANWLPNFEVINLSTGSYVLSFPGSHPQWLGDSHTFVDINFQDGRTEVYAFDVDTGTRTTLYATDQPFHLVVP
jgi:hypothetical protein